ncbi:MAG TPA: hypothetical protein VH640_08480 [Bryobacteraceae bacterium]
MTVEEQLERLTGIVASLADTVVAHDNQLDILIKVAQKHAESIANLERQWQAYLRTLPRQ